MVINKIKINIEEALELLYRHHIEGCKKRIRSIQLETEEALLDDEIKIGFQILLCFYHLESKNIKEAENYVNTILLEPRMQNFPLLYYRSLRASILLENKKKEHSQAISLYHKHSDFLSSKKNEFELERALLFSHLANCYIEIKDFQNGYDYVEKCIPVLFKYGYLYHLANSFKDKGNIYFYRSMWNQALEQYNKVQKLTKDLSDKSLLAPVLHNIGIIYFELNKKEEAYQHWNKALEIAKQFNKKEVIYPINTIFYAYYVEKKWEKILETANILMDTIREGNFPLIEARTYRTLGHYYREVEHNPIYLTYYSKALDIFKKHNHLEAGDLCFTIAACTNTLDLYKESASQYRKYIQQLKINYEHGMVSSL